MGDIANKIEPVRARPIGRAMRGVPDRLLWRWDKVGKSEVLEVARLTDGGASIDYRRPKDKEALLSLTNIRPKDGLRDRKAVDIPTGKPTVIDKVSIPIHNFDGVVEIPVQYDARLSKLTTKEEAFAVGFTESIKTTFSFQEGGEAASFKATQELELGFEARQDKTDTTGEQRGEDRGAGLTPVCPPGYDITFALTRTSQKMKTRLTGIGDLDFGLKLGKHWSGHWKGNDGEHDQTWPRWGQWNSLDEFLTVIKGEGRRDLYFAEHFWNNPASKDIIKLLEGPLDMPFDHTGDEFDGTTVLRVEQVVMRGPKYESQRLVIEDELVG